MSWADQTNIVLSGITQGALYSIVAVGFNVTYATTGVLNFAQGEMLMLGSVLGAFFATSLGWPLVPAVVATIAIVAAVGALEELVAVRPASRLGHGARGWLLSTLGVAILIRSIVAVALGQDLRAFPDIFSRVPTTIGGVRIIPQQVFVVAVSVGVALALLALYERTLLGKAFESVHQDREAAAFRGLPIGRLSTASFALGGAICALTGFVAAPLTGASPTVGFPFALKGFIAATIGGMGNIRGGLLGGILLGVTEALAAQHVGANYRNVTVFALLLLVLVARPQGILGHVSAREV